MADMVVLLHGIFRTSTCMAKFADFLRGKGYQVCNLDYPSTRHTISDLVEHIRAAVLEAEMSAGNDRIHFVGYSMGGLVIRAYLTRYKPKNLGKVVMVGTPNGGSPIADFLGNWHLYRYFYGPAGQELKTDQTALKGLYGPVDYELGIIAGNRAVDPISYAIIGIRVPNDGRVSVEATKLEGAADHIVIPATHTFIPQSKLMWCQALNFLQAGTFKR